MNYLPRKFDGAITRTLGNNWGSDDSPRNNVPKIPKKIDAQLLGIQILHISEKSAETTTECDLESVPLPSSTSFEFYSNRISIVAVHGLGANPATTWTAKKDNIESSNSQISVAQKTEYINWLSHPDMLPSRIPHAHIIAFNHDSQWYGDEAVSLRLDPLASSLLRAIIDERKECQNRPLIIIGHSLGGLIIEKALLRHEASKHVIPAVTAVILLGTPHAGTDHIGFPKILKRIIRSGTDIEPALLKSLRPENEGILDVVNNFAEMANSTGISVDCFFETQRSVIAKMFTKDADKAVIVDEKSATLRSWPCHPLRADHYTLNKFSDPKDRNWRVLQRVILDRYREASEKIESRERGTLRKNGDLVGRDGFLKEIDRAFEKSNRVALVGLGGIGKTEIAVHLTCRLMEQYPDCDILWVYGATQQSFDDAYSKIAEELNIPGWQEPTFDHRREVPKVLDRKDSRPWVMILDNADDYSAYFPPNDGALSEKEQRDYLANCLPYASENKGRIIVTTRNAKLGEEMNPECAPLFVQELTPDNARLLLKSKLVNNVKWEEEPADMVLESLDYIPLAITQAAAFINRNKIATLKSYLGKLSMSQKSNYQSRNSDPANITLIAQFHINVKDVLSYELRDSRRHPGTPSAIFRTWQISYEQIQKDSTEAANKLSLMAVLDNQSIPKILVSKGAELDVADMDAIQVLIDFSLIKGDENYQFFTMHPLQQLRRALDLAQNYTYAVDPFSISHAL
ncbi:hypothetical protein LAWI1_G005763 [Lachnellula willkommii]|uniref:NB-ARC domain-containing protein n=1 Tax=Lachnellula willkommii TaxID=215461 RepID=A0A559M999_9HELO|nr:hypothetical protein LAWI1_G005763 [Lachnellula willkommii]